MNGLFGAVHRISKYLNIVAGISLTFLMLLTIADVVLRGFNKPVVGAYELVAFAGALVVGFSLPQTALLKAHIYIDFLIMSFSKRVQNLFNTTTRCAVIILFFLIGWNLLAFGWDLQKSGEVSLTLQMPFYPVAYGVAVSCFIQCMVLALEIVEIHGGKGNE
jgi:TRAP-type C4-dicarboxylate transport system permease small subunit